MLRFFILSRHFDNKIVVLITMKFEINSKYKPAGDPPRLAETSACRREAGQPQFYKALL